ncbi:MULTISPECIES: DUF4082 domain-containing protein [Microbacterium]|uniref:DUF4082 domain-containing protein n=1 Tax=Microbacterium TaxID=33882 RepID=UPI000D658AF8|nr:MULTISPECIES: DUF4082 domain-containing protein [Microbacterium]
MTNTAMGTVGVRRRWSSRARIGTFVAIVALVATAFVAFEPTPVAQAASPCGASINPIVCENQKPGTDPEDWDISGAGDSSIQGFATDISVNAGSRIDFKIDTDARAYDIDIYRTGWYQGLGARFITSVPVTAQLPQNQPECISDVTTELYDCGTWGVSASWNVPADAVSGVYVAKLTRADDGGSSHIIFIVRKDGNTSDVLFQTSDTTWQAYNTYGGSSFYQGAALGRGYKLSYNRPFNTRRPDTARDFYFSSEFATVRFLERNGYDMSYIAGVDTDRRGGELLNHDVFLSVGHDEYWSGAQRANIMAARDAGVNLQFLTGNEGYWRTRYEPAADGSNTPYRTLVSYKETWANGKIDPAPEWTGTWRDPRFADATKGGHSPENALTGTMYFVNDDDLAVTVSAAEGKYRMWRNTNLTSLAAGTTAALAPHTVGYESNEVSDNGFSPGGLIRLSTTVGPTPQYLTDYGNTVVPGTTRHNVTLYKAPSGALVFSAASIQWGWGLDQEHDGAGAPADPRMQQAQVNLLADMGAQPGSLMTGLVAATKSTDVTAPTTTITSPTADQTVANGTSVTVTGTASDSGGGRVAGVEVSTDGGATWRPAVGTDTWTYTYVQQGSGTASIIARAIDDSANFSAAGVKRTVTVTGPFSALGDIVPAIPSANDTQAVELGLRFVPDFDGYVAGVRFYKGSTNVGTHVGALWNSSGALLNSATFTNESATGWQSVQFTSPVPVIAGQTYTVSYTAPSGGYSVAERYWPYSARASSPVTVTSAVGAAAPGVYGSPGRFPTNAWKETNYFVDAIFTKSDTSPLRVQERVPAAGVSSVSPSTPISVVFTRPADPATVQITVATAAGAAVSGAVSYDAASRKATFTPAAALQPSTKYVVTPAAVDANGVGLESGAAWSFTTRAEDRPVGDCPCSLFSESRVPTVVSAVDSALVTLGVKFSPTTAGVVSAIKFYKGSANLGSHTGALWSADGTKLASATFTDESTQGWQIATLDKSVTVQPGVTYIASYVAPQGRYSATSGAFSAAYSRGPLTVPAGGAVYTYSSGFPTSSSSTDYGVDVVFTLPTDVPTITERTPAPEAVDVAPGTTVTATFDEGVQTGFTGSVRADGVEVAGAWGVSNAQKTLTFTPASPFLAGARVAVTLSGVKSASGTTASPFTWSFTVGGGDPAVSLLATGVPASVDGDTSAVELGMAFTASEAGQIRALRYYKTPGTTGVHTGSLWGPDGQRLAQVTFAAESASGWQRAVLSTPVAIVPGGTYLVSYYSPNGRYAYTSRGFSTPVTNGPLTAISPNNGRYRYGTGGVIPTSSYNSTNYFADVEFVKDTGPAIAVASVSPAKNSTDVAITSDVAATLTGDPGTRAVALTVVGPDGAVAGTSTFDSGSRRITFDPTERLKSATEYSATVTSDGAAVDTWTFTTAGGTQTLFGTATPRSTVPDTDPVEVGTRFQVAEPGEVTAIRFYKGTGATGAHRGTLWDGAGNPLAQVDFVNETADGWQRAALAEPVAVEPGTVYTVSYFAPSGRYAYTPSYFAQERTVGFITAPATTNGRFLYSPTGGFPVTSFNATAYFVDAEIDFDGPDAPPPAPTLTSFAPSAGATGVDPNALVVSANVADASSASLTVSDASGAVPGASSFDEGTGAVVFTPTGPWQRGRTYSVAVTANGAPVADGAWSFTTRAAVTVGSTSPSAGQTNVALDTTVSATLTNASSASLALSSAGTPVAGTSSFVAATGVVTFTPSTPLEPARTYTASVTADGFAVGSGWSFTTIPNPSLTAKTPASDATNVDPVTAVVSATLAYASTGAITVTSGGAAVAGTSSFNASTGVVTFTPTAALQRARTYAVTATANGAAVTGGTWSFTTLPNPAITARTPASSATGVLVNAPISATISNVSSAAITVTTGGAAVAGSSSFNAATGVVTFTPAAALGFSRTYSVTATANGGAISGGAWSFTTIAQATRSSSSPTPNATNVNPTGRTITATLSSGAQAGAITLAQGTTNVPGTSTYNATTRVVSFAPTATLDWTKSYTATVTANGGAVSGGTWSFTTMAKPDQVSLFTTGTPTSANTSTVQNINAGTRFKTNAPGVVTAIKFYKGALNVGTHTGYLWDATGQRLATVTFTGESSSGWQTATLSTAVRLTVGAEYRVSMYSTSRVYASTSGGLSSVVTNGPISTIATGGAYSYSTGYPSTTTTTKLWVDVVFDPDN